MKITYASHACFLIEGSKTLLIDPFFSGNPKAPAGLRDSVAPDYILLTHGHGDHLGDAVVIAKRTRATVLCTVELAAQLRLQGINIYDFNVGGSFKADGLTVKMTAAVHGNNMMSSSGSHYAGLAVGYLIDLDGHRIYHAGDTALFYDMAAVIARDPIDIACLPIGGRYTMDASDALCAAAWLKAKTVLPMHYDTFEAISADAADFCRRVEDETPSACLLLHPGSTWVF